MTWLESPIMLACVAVFLGCIMDALIKHAGAAYAALTIAAMRFTVASVFAGILSVSAGRPMADKRNTKFLLARGALQAIAATTFFHSLSILGLAEATVVAFMAPLIMAALAMTFLKEPACILLLAAIGIGFAGVLITVSGEPLTTDANPRRLEGVASALTAAVTYAAANILLRVAAQSTPSPTVVLFSNVTPMIILAPIALMTTGTPALPDVPLFILIGAGGFGLWYFMTLAYARAPAQRLAPLEYTALVWSAAFGFFVFAEVPKPEVFVGATVIMLAVGLTAWDEKRARLQGDAP